MTDPTPTAAPCTHPIVQTPVDDDPVNVLMCCTTSCRKRWTAQAIPADIMPDLEEFCGGLIGLIGAVRGGINLVIERGPNFGTKQTISFAALLTAEERAEVRAAQTAVNPPFLPDGSPNPSAD